MVLAVVGSFGYKLFFLLHIFAVVVAFAPGFVNPILSARYKKEGTSIPGELGEKLYKDSQQIHGPALVLVAFFGLGMVGMSDKVYEFSQTWVSIALLLWFLMVGVVFGLLLPAEKKAAAGDEVAESRVAMFGGMMHVLFLLMLVDMIWKPGF